MAFLEFLKFEILRHFCDVVMLLKRYHTTDSDDLY
jgi:hypothetical protein